MEEEVNFAETYAVEAETTRAALQLRTNRRPTDLGGWFELKTAKFSMLVSYLLAYITQNHLQVIIILI